MKDLYVDVTYRNRDMQVVAEETFDLGTYTAMLAQGIQRVITEVSTLITKATHQSSDLWSDDVIENFTYIRRLLLDRAGEISRLPENIRLGVTEDVPKADHAEETCRS